MSGGESTATSPALEELQEAISPDIIAYYSEGGAIPSAAIRACAVIGAVSDAGMLQALLEHSKMLRAPHEKEFPIGRIRSAITERLVELGV